MPFTPSYEDTTELAIGFALGETISTDSGLYGAYSDDWHREIAAAIENRLRLYRVTCIEHHATTVLNEGRVATTHQFAVEATHCMLAQRQVSLKLLMDADQQLRVQAGDYLLRQGGW